MDKPAKGSREDIETLLMNISMSTGLSNEQLQGCVDYIMDCINLHNEQLKELNDTILQMQ